MGDDTSIGISDSAERIEFDGAGDISVLGANLGIGTDSPAVALEIDGNAADNTTVELLRLSAAQGEAQSCNLIMKARHDDSGGATLFSSIESARNDGGTTGLNLALQPNGGNVGIGTTSPETNFHIYGSGTQYIGVGSSNAGGAGIIIDGDANGDLAGSDYSYLLHYSSGIMHLVQDSDGGTNELHMGTAGTQSKMVIDASGYVGIGPSSLKTIYSAYKQLAIGANSATLMGDANHFSMSENAYLASDGNWKQVGTGAATNIYQDGGTIGFRTTASGSADATITWNSTTIDSSGNATFGGNITMGDGKTIIGTTDSTNFGTLIGTDTSANNIVIGSTSVQYYNDIVFNSAGATGDEILRMKAAGRVGIGTGSTVHAKFHIEETSSGQELIYLNHSVTGADQTYLLFKHDGTSRGTISVTDSNDQIAYNTTTSDKRLKKDFEDWDESILPAFKSLNPQLFNFIHSENNGGKRKGYMAQDNVDSFPEAYTTSKVVDGDDTEYYSFNPTGMVAYLMKAIKELTAKVEALENA